jgi:ppGpp synthetase/RelA/SpoT-type nucleotidyltranferase
MLTQKDIEAKLVREYFDYRPIYEKIINIAKPQIEYKLIDIRINKKHWERIDVISRVKELASALDKLKRGREGRILEETDSFSMLNDMAALKIKVFPNKYLQSVDEIINGFFHVIEADHQPPKQTDGENYNLIERLKYVVKLQSEYGIDIRFEIQIVPFLLDAFIDVEHDIIYKPGEGLPSKEIIELHMKHPKAVAIGSLISFAKEFSEILEKWEKPGKS